MRLSFRAKQSFYEHLSQLLRAGVALPAAMEKLASSSRGAERKMLGALRKHLSAGDTIAQAFSRLRPAVGEMEVSAVAALERSGRIDRGLQQLADYFGALDAAQKEILQRSGYPFFVIHFGVLTANLPRLLNEGGIVPYLRAVGFSLFVLYGVIVILFIAGSILSDLGGSNSAVDALLGRIPLLGKMRRSFALARFCATYDMQLEAGVNVFDSLQAAGRASRGGRIRAAVKSALPKVRQGAQLGPSLTQSSVFPESFVRSFLIAEETGELDRTLGRLAAQYLEDGSRALRRLSEWIPRLIFLGTAAYVGWIVVKFYSGYLDEVMRQTDSI